ncbi:uncharacterized protein [Macaca fascicularis]|uniref:uncharacterized protein n=1 Tax=Macaca fascicularis TaxID=9541 RepID=UPI001E253C23|nr:translation initiation factor IF-2-like [Macaca fascicularis]XP_045244302.1 translation initiation factor IF-2-like [Macaca fascicularis]
MARREGRAGPGGGGKTLLESFSPHSVEPPRRCAGAAGPPSSRAVPGGPRPLFFRPWGPGTPLALPLLPRGVGSSSGGPAGAFPCRPVTRHPGSARPGPGSPLFPRWAPRSGAAPSCGAAEVLARAGRASGSVHAALSEPGPFLPDFSGVDSPRSWEAAVRPAWSRRRRGAAAPPRFAPVFAKLLRAKILRARWRILGPGHSALPVRITLRLSPSEPD